MKDGIGVFDLFINLKDRDDAELLFNEFGLFPKVVETSDNYFGEIRYGYKFSVMTSKRTIINISHELLDRLKIDTRVMSYKMN